MRKDDAIYLRISETDKKAIAKAAAGRKLSVSEYLLRIHSESIKKTCPCCGKSV